MLSRQEKQEMLRDARSVSRRNNFRQGRDGNVPTSLDGYLKFLNSVQQIACVQHTSLQKTVTKRNTL